MLLVSYLFLKKNDCVIDLTLYVPKWPRSGPALFWP